jgi:hypothetical protein
MNSPLLCYKAQTTHQNRLRAWWKQFHTNYLWLVHFTTAVCREISTLDNSRAKQMSLLGGDHVSSFWEWRASCFWVHSPALLVWTWKSQVSMTTDIGNHKIILLIFLILNWNYFLKWQTLTIYVKFECKIKELSGKHNHIIKKNLKVYGRFGDIDKNVANRLKDCKIQVSMCQCNWSVTHTHYEKESVPLFRIKYQF